MNRRHFLRAGTLAMTTGAYAREPIERSGCPNLRLGLAAYSFKRHYRWIKGKPQEQAGEQVLDMAGFIDYCAEHHVPAAELTSYFFDPEITHQELRRLRLRAQNQGVAISGTAIGNNFAKARGPHLDQEIAEAKTWIDRTAVLGVSHIRFFACTANDFEKDPGHLGIAIEALEECAEHAGQQGVVIGVENHGNLTVEQMLEIMKRVESPWFGMNLDTANYVLDTDEEVAEAIARSLPYAVNVQIKVKRKRPDGSRVEVDLQAIVKLLQKGGYQGHVVLEYEEEDSFEGVPKALEELRSAIRL